MYKLRKPIVTSSQLAENSTGHNKGLCDHVFHTVTTFSEQQEPKFNLNHVITMPHMYKLNYSALQ